MYRSRHPPIERIDVIVRQKQRDVLYVKFSLPLKGNESPVAREYKRLRYWQMLPGREACISWLVAQGIGYKICFYFLATADAAYQVPYCIYIDLAVDKSAPLVQALTALLAYPDGSMKFADAILCHLSLEKAMESVV